MTMMNQALHSRENAFQIIENPRLNVINCPERLNAAFVLSFDRDIESLINRKPFILLDLEQTSFIDSRGLSLLIRLYQLTSKARGGLYLKDINPALIRFLKLNRVWDIFQPRTVKSSAELLNQIQNTATKPGFYTVSETEAEYTIIRFFGRLDSYELNHDSHAPILNKIMTSHCILDLKHLNFVDSTGLTLFIKILQLSSHSDRKCVLCGLNNKIKQLFIITKIINRFTLAADVLSALKKMQRA